MRGKAAKTGCRVLWLLVLVTSVDLVQSQEESGSCYGAGSIAATVILTILFTTLLLAILYLLWKKYRKRKDLILETDPEKGKGAYAFDNPGFKEPGLTPAGKALEKAAKTESAPKPKWNQWAPIAALTTKSNEKRKTLDDSAIDIFQGNEVKVVELRSHDFTGLGFNICGNMKDGIYIKDVLHRGPASESGKLSSGDRINSVTISFEHMVYEDALTILSYASPYEVIIEARGGKIVHHGSGQGAQPSHPVYRSSSCVDLFNSKLAKKKLFASPDDYTSSLSSTYSSLQKSRSNMTTLERKTESPPIKPPNHHPKKTPKAPLNPELLKNQLEQKILADHHHNLLQKQETPPKIDAEMQKTTDNKLHKFGVRVLPPTERSPKTAELSQNENNANLERVPIAGIDEVDETAKPQPKKREKKPESDALERNGSLTGSGIKRDGNGIPQEMPTFMLNAANAARSNRRAAELDELEKTPKKAKGKAPAPPGDDKANSFDEIHSVSDEMAEEAAKLEEETVEIRFKQPAKDYNSDSDLENDNESSVNTIELNSSDITIHQAEENGEKETRKTASTGDLTKIHKKSGSGTLERAQSLDITDSGAPNLKRKAKEDEEPVLRKEPRLSLILDGLSTFQRNRLKKSTEWGNLEDALFKLNQDDSDRLKRSVALEEVELDLGSTGEEFDALVNKIKEIKEAGEVPEEMPPKKPVKNQIWPSFEPKTNGIGGTTLESDHPRLVSVEKRQRKPPLVKETADDAKQEPEFGNMAEEPIFAPEIVKIGQKPVLPDKKESLLALPKKYPVNQTATVELKTPIIQDTVSFVVPPEAEQVPLVIEAPKPIENDIISMVFEPKNETTPILELEEPPAVLVDEIDAKKVHLNNVDQTRNFLFTEKIACSLDEPEQFHYLLKSTTNVSDDIKASLGGTLERPKSDDAKLNVSNVTVTTGLGMCTSSAVPSFRPPPEEEQRHSLELNVNETSELYTTALDSTITGKSDFSRVTISTPDIIKNLTLAEALNTVNNDSVMIQGPSSLTFEIPQGVKEVEVRPNFVFDVNNSSLGDDGSLTYITEIEVLTPKMAEVAKGADFDDYMKNFERFAPKMQKSEVSAEKEVSKIQERAEEQLKKLPEMRFSIGEAAKAGEKRQSQIEMLRSNFERSPPKKAEKTSRIPISTTMKTPPMSPERRDSRNLDLEPDRALLELMSASVHSTPVGKAKGSKNVTVTSIRSNARAPSGLPVLGGASRPPIPPRRGEDEVQVTANGGRDSSFKQWVFNPGEISGGNSITNIVVAEGNGGKQQK